MIGYPGCIDFFLFFVSFPTLPYPTCPALPCPTLFLTYIPILDLFCAVFCVCSSLSSRQLKDWRGAESKGRLIDSSRWRREGEEGERGYRRHSLNAKFLFSYSLVM